MSGEGEEAPSVSSIISATVALIKITGNYGSMLESFFNLSAFFCTRAVSSRCNYILENNILFKIEPRGKPLESQIDRNE